jgi:hypothetical protein
MKSYTQMITEAAKATKAKDLIAVGAIISELGYGLIEFDFSGKNTWVVFDDDTNNPKWTVHMKGNKYIVNMKSQRKVVEFLDIDGVIEYIEENE